MGLTEKGKYNAGWHLTQGNRKQATLLIRYPCQWQVASSNQHRFKIPNFTTLILNWQILIGVMLEFTAEKVKIRVEMFDSTVAKSEGSIVSKS